ncbi:aldose 1-epimerase family protein [Shimia sp. W99]
MTTDHVTISNDRLTLGVAPLGAEMQYLRTSDGDDLLWHGDPAFWSGRAPVLFPIVGRAVDDVIAVANHRATMPQHGFARRSHFDLVEGTATKCHHVLRASDGTRESYPFDFALHLTHELSGNTLDVTARVENLSNRPMPFGFGFHPAFLWPLPGAADKPHYVQLAAGGSPRRQPLRDDGLLDSDLVPGPFENGQLELAEQLFSDGALVFPDGSDSLRYGPADGPWLDFTFHNLPDLALWKPAGAPFLCIEPWHGTASRVGDGPEIGERPNSTTLPPGASQTFGYTLRVTV